MRASPDVVLVASALHIVHRKVGRDWTEERVISRKAVIVPKLPGHGLLVLVLVLEGSDQGYE